MADLYKYLLMFGNVNVFDRVPLEVWEPVTCCGLATCPVSWLVPDPD